MWEEDEDLDSDEIDSDVEIMLYSQLHHEWAESQDFYGTDHHDPAKALRDGTSPFRAAATASEQPSSSSSTATNAKLDRQARLKPKSPKQLEARKSRNKFTALKTKPVKCKAGKRKASVRSEVIVVSSESDEQRDSKYSYRRNDRPKTAVNGPSKAVDECNSAPNVIYISSDSDASSFDGPLPETDLYLHVNGAAKRNANSETTTGKTSVPDVIDITLSDEDDAGRARATGKRKRKDETEPRPTKRMKMTKEDNWKEDIKLHRKSLEQVVGEAMTSFYDSDCTDFDVDEVLGRAKSDDWFIHADDTLHTKLSRREYDRLYNQHIICDNCNQRGHIARNCPEPKKEYVCHVCSGQDHGFRRCHHSVCPLCRKNHPIARCHLRMHSAKLICQCCRQAGHLDDLCPDLWRRYHLTTRPGPLRTDGVPSKLKDPTSAWCCNCGRKGHFVHECKRRRMEDAPPPVSAQVMSYTTTPVYQAYPAFQDKPAVKNAPKADQNWTAMKQKLSPRNGIRFNKRKAAKLNRRNTKNYLQTENEGNWWKSNSEARRFKHKQTKKKWRKREF